MRGLRRSLAGVMREAEGVPKQHKQTVRINWISYLEKLFIFFKEENHTRVKRKITQDIKWLFFVNFPKKVEARHEEKMSLTPK